MRFGVFKETWDAQKGVLPKVLQHLHPILQYPRKILKELLSKSFLKFVSANKKQNRLLAGYKQKKRFNTFST